MIILLYTLLNFKYNVYYVQCYRLTIGCSYTSEALLSRYVITSYFNSKVVLEILKFHLQRHITLLEKSLLLIL